MTSNSLSLKELLNSLPQTGTVEWIGLRPSRRVELIEIEQVELSTSQGLVGDRYGGRSGKRQVTLVQAEHLSAIASMSGRLDLNENQVARLLRRNIVVRGLNLLALKDQQFKIGEAVLEYTGLCHPCSRMEEYFGSGGYNTVRGHGGINARVVKDGLVRIGDSVNLYKPKA